MLKGKKAYIVAGLIGIAGISNLVIKFLNGEPVTINDIMALLSSPGLAALRAGIKNG